MDRVNNLKNADDVAVLIELLIKFVITTCIKNELTFKILQIEFYEETSNVPLCLLTY